MKGGKQKAAKDGDRAAVMVACVRDAGLKLTPQRLAIVRELAGDEAHPTAQELFDRLRAELPSMSFATVYNTLDALARAGLCASLSLAPGPSRFDPNMAPHHHAVCDRCGQVRDIPLDEGPEQTSRSPSGRDAPEHYSRSPSGRDAPAPPVARVRQRPPSTRPKAPKSLAAMPGFEVRAIERIYRGLCATCAKAS